MVARRAHNPEVVRFKSHLRNQKEKHPLRVLFFLVLKCDLNPAHIRVTGGSGHGVRPPPGAGGGSATREKIRRAGGGVTPRPARLYIFDRAMKNPTSATKEKSTPCGCSSFCRWDLNRATSEGGSGLGARPPPGAGGGSATREKIRRVGGGVTPPPARLYFRQGNEKSNLRNQKEKHPLRVLFFLVLKCDLNPARIRVTGGSGPRVRPPPGAE